MSDENIQNAPHPSQQSDINQPGPSQTQTETVKGGGKVSARDDVLSAFNEIEAKNSEKAGGAEKAAGASADGASSVPPSASKTSETAKGPERGPDGKFLKAADQADPAQAQANATAQPQPVNAPPAWKGAAKVDWNRLPRPVQEAIAEQFKQYGELEAKFQPLAPILAPREQALVAQYGGVPQAINQLFALSDYASRDPQGFIHWFAAQRGINLQQPVQQQHQPAQQFTGQQPHAASMQNIPPELAPLADRLNGLERILYQQQQAWRQQETAEAQAVQHQANSEVQSFIANSAQYPYANDLRNEMAQIFASGEAKTLDEAYQKASWRNDAVRERMIADRTKAELERQAAAAAEKKSAAVSVSGSPGGQPIAQAGNRKATVRDDVLAAARETGFYGASRL